MNESRSTRFLGMPMWFLAVLPLMVALGAMGTYRSAIGPWQRPAGGAPDGGKFYTVEPVSLDVRVVKDGEIQAVKNIEIVCMVEGQTTIVQLVKEGAEVKKGDVLVMLDSAAIRQKIEDSTLELTKAEAEVINAREMLQIQESQNATDLQAAQLELEVARLALAQYTDGAYPQAVTTAETTLKMARITVKNTEEDLEQAKRLYGKGFVTAADVQDAELELTTATNDLRKAETDLLVLTKYQHPTDLATKKNAVAAAEQGLSRVQKANASSLAKQRAAVESAEVQLTTLKRRGERLEQQLEYCTIKAPADGMVVYAENDRGANMGMQEGAQVRERQLLLRLPDTSVMKAVLRVNESQVSRLMAGQRGSVRIVGVPEPVGATLTKISPLADSGQRWWNPDLKEYPVELVLDRTPPNLKPGMGVQGEIYVERLADVLAVPLGAIYSERSDSYVFARQGEAGEVRPVRVQVGQASETHARVVEGLGAGDHVLLLRPGQGRELLERAGIKDSTKGAGPDGGGRDRKGREGERGGDGGPGAVAQG